MMSNQVRILFTVLGLLHLLGANPVPSFNEKVLEEIIIELDHLKDKITDESCFIPIPYDNEEEASVAEISCRTFQSLKQVCVSERKNLHMLNVSLATMLTKSMECSINNTEQKDLTSVIEDLLPFFRSHMRILVNERLPLKRRKN